MTKAQRNAIRNSMAALVAMALMAAGCGGVEVATGSSGSGGVASSAVGTSASTTSGMATSTTTGVGGGAQTCPPGDGVVLAMDQIDIGESQAADADWRNLGFNLDGLDTHPNSYGTVCTVASNPGGGINFDGLDGRDNSFGKYFVLGFAQYQPLTSAFNAGLAKGEHTMMLDFVGLTAAPDHAVQLTRMYRGDPLGATPKFDGSDCWPVNPDWLNNPANIDSATTVFEQGSIVANQWTSGVSKLVKFTLPFMFGGTLTLRIHSARMTLELAADHHSGAKGMLGGILDPNELLLDLQKALGTAPEACPLDGSFTDAINNSADIMFDGTQDPKKACNGISIGFAFTMKEVQRGVVGPVVPAAPLCP